MSETTSTPLLTPIECDLVSKLDPLNLDEFMAELPFVNMAGDTQKIIDTTETATEKLFALEDTNSNEAFAALRDMDFLLGSGIRHGLDPITDVDGLEEGLIRLGKIAGTVPRGSVYTYSLANPNDNRQRSFTGSYEENEFIDAVRVGTGALDCAIFALSQCSEYDKEGLIAGLDSTTEAMGDMVAAIGRVMRTVSPEYFTNNLRPYFDPAIIDGVSYTGAGGAQMQLLGIDRILWGNSDASEEYVRFYAENFQYLTPEQQRSVSLYFESNDRTVLETIVDEELGQDDPLSMSALRLLKSIRKFRYPHRKVARDNFKLRSNDAVGSGAYTPEILDLLIQKTENSIADIGGEA